MNDACPLVLIRWVDSRQPTSAWCFLAEMPAARPVECASVGWLLRDGEDAKVICQSVGDLESQDDAQASGVMTIPARCIVAIDRLEEVDPINPASSLASDPASARSPTPQSTEPVSG
jgi:hypothetical protein